MSESAPPPPPALDDVTADGATTTSAGQAIDQNRGRIFPCEGCGADLEFHIGQQRLKCPFCGFEKEIEIPKDREVAERDYHAMLERLREWKEEEPPEDSNEFEIRCESCGGTTLFVGSLTSSECPYCASPIQRENVHRAGRRVPVDGVLPFQVDERKARENLAEWVRSRWFAPNEFRKRGVEGKFSGVFLPYWTFDSLTYTEYSGQRGENYTVTVGTGKDRRTETRTRWYPASGEFQRFFDDVMAIATRGMPLGLVHELEPWPIASCVPFNPEMLAGFLARTYETSLDEGFTDAKARIDAALESDVRSRIGGDQQRIHSIDTSYSAITFKHLLMPTWLMAYRYHDKPYQVMINACTGEVQGERPYSWVKITLAVLAVLAVVLVIIAFRRS